MTKRDPLADEERDGTGLDVDEDALFRAILEGFSDAYETVLHHEMVTASSKVVNALQARINAGRK